MCIRDSYEGTKYNHACALYDASQHTNLIQVGIRSMDSLEKQYVKEEQCYFAQDIQWQETWMKDAIQQMTKDVYILLI